MRKYIANTSYLLLERMIRMAVNFFIIVYVARYLGPDGFGQLSYVESLVVIFLPVASLGIDAVVVKELVDCPDEHGSILWTAFLLRLSAGFVSMLLLLGAAIMLDVDSLQAGMLAVMAVALIVQALGVFDCYFQSRVKSIYVVQVQMAQLVISVGLKIGFVWAGMNLFWFAVALAFDYVVFNFGLLANFYRVVIKGRARPGLTLFANWSGKCDRELAVRLLRSAFPLVVSGVAVSIYMRVDQLMIKEMIGDQAVGLYAAATRISEAWYFLPMIVAASLFPALIGVTRKEYESRLVRLYSLLVWGGVLVAVPVSAFSTDIVVAIFGHDYTGSAVVLAIHIWTGIFVSLGIVSSKRIVVDGTLSYAMYRTLIGMSINVVLNVVLIPCCGIVGAAIATLCSQVLAAYFVDLFFCSARRDFFLKTQSFVYPFLLLGRK